MIKHIRRWNIWRKHCMNSPFYKFLVLIGFRKSPTMCFTALPEEWLAYEEKMHSILQKGENNDNRSN